LRMSHALFKAFNKHYRTLQNGTQEFPFNLSSHVVKLEKNLTSVMYARVPSKFKSFFRIRSNTCLRVHFYDVTSRYGSKEVTGWTTAEYLINFWLVQRISVRHLSVEILRLPNLLLNGCPGTERSGCGADHSAPFVPSYFLFKCPFRNYGSSCFIVANKRLSRIFKKVVLAQFKGTIQTFPSRD